MCAMFTECPFYVASSQYVLLFSSRLLQGWPNTYTFTKALCEEMLVEEGVGLPISIFRPAAGQSRNLNPTFTCLIKEKKTQYLLLEQKNIYLLDKNYLLTNLFIQCYHCVLFIYFYSIHHITIFTYIKETLYIVN